MSTKRDLTELLTYAVKKAEASTEVRVAWAGLSNLEKVLAKRASEKGQMIHLAGIRKLAALIEKPPAGTEGQPAKRDFASYRFKKKDMSKKACSVGCRCPKCKSKKMKKSAACVRMIGLLKKASRHPAFPGLTKKAIGLEGVQALTGMSNPAPAAAAAGSSFFDEPSASKFISGAWGKTPGWGKALAVLAGLGVLGHGMYGAGREWQKRYDPGVDPAAKGIGLDRDLANALREQMAKGTAWASELGGMQRGFRQAYAPLYGIQ